MGGQAEQAMAAHLDVDLSVEDVDVPKNLSLKDRACLNPCEAGSGLRWQCCVGDAVLGHVPADSTQAVTSILGFRHDADQNSCDSIRLKSIQRDKASQRVSGIKVLQSAKCCTSCHAVPCINVMPPWCCQQDQRGHSISVILAHGVTIKFWQIKVMRAHVIVQCEAA